MKIPNPFKAVMMLIAFFIYVNHAYSQKTVTGTVTDSTGLPLQGVSVVVKGTKKGTSTDQQGNFSINANAKATLVFSYIGYSSKEMMLIDESPLKVQLSTGDNKVNEVVVTALGIKKEKKAVGYAVQEIKGADLVKAREPNGIGGLTGKVAGLRITNTPNMFSNPTITLRGVAPLIVVDGVPISSDSWNLSPDDIETYTILKGPTASALYGSRGLNGAVEITTKRGTRNRKGFTIEFNSSTQFQTGFNAQPKVQQSYGPGSAGQYAFGTGAPGGGGVNDYDYFVWGPKFNVPDASSPSGLWETTQWDSEYDPNNTYTVKFGDGSTYTSHLKPKPWVNKGRDNLKNFLRNGLLSINNIAVSSAGEKGNFRMSLSQTYQLGMVPNTNLNITNFNMSGAVNFNSKLRLESNITYNRQYTKNYPSVSYSPNSFIYNMFLWNASNYDVREFRNYWVPGKEGIKQKWVENWRYNNPYFVAYEQTQGYYRDNVYGYVKLNYKLNNDLSAYVRSYITTAGLSEENKYPVSTDSYQPWQHVGGYEERHTLDFENNTDVLITYDKRVNPSFTVKTSVGGNLRTVTQRIMYGRTDGGLSIPGLYTLSNSVNPYSPSTSSSVKQVQSVYGYADLGFKNYLFLNLTGRWDRSSALPLNKNSYFYPSASLSAVISDMVRLPAAISFLKLRASYANVGSDFNLYSYSATYGAGTRWDGNLPLYYGSTLYNPDSLLPNKSISYETGLEMRLLKNRFGIDFAFFKTYDGPNQLNLGVSQASGFNSRQVTGGQTERRGFELTLTGRPVSTKNFTWNVTANWSTYHKYLRKIYGGQTRQDRFVSIGTRTDPYVSTVFSRSPDGQVEYDQSTGYPIVDPYSRQLGWTLPDGTASLINNIRYKDFQLSFQFDGVYGGKVFDQTAYYLWSGGNHPNSVTKERDDEVLKGLATMVGQGVVRTAGEVTYNADGSINSDSRKYAKNNVPTFYSEFAQRYWSSTEMSTVNKTFAKLREVVITYTVPASLIKKLRFFESANVSVVGRNLFYFSKVKDFDLDAITSESGSSGLQTPSVKSFGINFNFIF